MISTFVARLTCGSGLFFALTGCISVTRQPFDRSANADIKSIAVVRVAEPLEYKVVNLGGAGTAFGLIGGAIDAAEQARKADEFTQKARGEKLDVGSSFTAAIETELKKQGYVVTVVSSSPSAGGPPLPPGDPAYSRLGGGADAVLDVHLNAAGYISHPDSRAYAPWLGATARLFSAKSGAIVYQQTFVQGGGMRLKNVEYLPPMPPYSYGSFDDLMGHSKAAAEGLDKAAGLMALSLAEQLSRGSEPVVAAPPPGPAGDGQRVPTGAPPAGEGAPRAQ